MSKSENCKICGKPLFTEESKIRGMGLTCWRAQKARLQNEKMSKEAIVNKVRKKP